MKIGLVQYNPAWEDKTTNQVRLQELLKESSPDVSLLIFTEMTLTGFTMASKENAEDFDGQTVKFFASLARHHDCHILAGCIEKASPLPFNSLIHLNPKGELVTTYRKIHTIPYYNEHLHYQNGASLAVTTIKDFRIGLSICFDLRFPELYRSYIDENVHMVLNIANWPATRAHHWKTLMRARAIENQCYMVGVNRVGTGNGIVFSGGSNVVDPIGEELLKPSSNECVLTVELTLETVKAARQSFPVLELKRIKV